MKKIFVVLFLLLLITAGGAEAANVVRAFTCLTGGTTGCLDKIADAAITDGDIGLVVTSNTLYFYQFNDSATDAESSPTYIRPDDYSTSGVWYLVTARVAGLNTGRSSTPEFNFYDGDCTDSDSNARIQVNCTDTGSNTEDCDLTIATQTGGVLTTRITIDGDGAITIAGGDLALGSNSLTMTGSIAATGSRVTKGWFTDVESTNMPTVGGTALLTSLTAPQFTTIELGDTADTTLARSGAGAITVEGVAVLLSGGALGTPTSGDTANLTINVGNADTTLTRSAAGVVAVEGAVLATAAASQTGTHASPSTSNPLAPTWTTAMHQVWYGATGEIDLPAVSGYTGRGVIIYNTGAYTITVDPNSSEVIVRDGTVQTGGVSFTLSSGAGNYVAIFCDGARWITLGYKGTLAEGS